MGNLKEIVRNDIKRKAEIKVIEQNNADFLLRLIDSANKDEDIQRISQLSVLMRRTGFVYQPCFENRLTDEIHYFRKNNELSFEQGGIHHELIIGDNYHALQNLLIKCGGKPFVDIIYIDPPYAMDGTGNYAKENFTNRITRDHLLSMMEPRLQLAKQLLNNTGVIFCSIDDKNYAYLKCLFNDIFEEANVETMIWHKVDNDSGKMKVTHRFRVEHEYIIVAYKDKSSTYFKKYLTDRNYKNKYTNPDNDPRGEYKQGIISDTEEKSSPNSENYYSVTTPSGKVYTRRWRVSEEEMKKLISDNRIYFGKNGDAVPSRKVFINEQGLATPVSILENFGTAKTAGNEIEDILTNRKFFKYPKPTELIKQLLRISSNKNSIILDFFAGSGTTGQAVLELNKEDSGSRKFILCTNNEITDEIIETIIGPKPKTKLENDDSEKLNEWIKEATAIRNNSSNKHLGIAQSVTSKRLKRVMTGECYDKTKTFKWLKNNQPLGDSLDVFDIEKISPLGQNDKNPFDVIDEKIYGFMNMTKPEKISWVCENFESTLEENTEDI